MALSFTRFSWLWLGGKEKDQMSNGSSLINPVNSLGGEWGLGLRGEPESLKFYSTKGVDYDTRVASSSSNNRKSKKKWKSREERMIRRIDKEYDVVLVPSDGVCLSGSESDDSDWSIGWLEPHAPEFVQSDDEADDDDDDNNSFAVLVPCYRHDCNKQVMERENEPSVPFLNAVKNLPIDYSADSTKYMEQWLSSLQKF